jgi:GNAT superfamily N-acetyltransferase
LETITRLSAEGFRARVEGLAGLLVDTVAGGSSLGFLAPFGSDAAVAWWHGRLAAVADGTLAVWVTAGPGTGGGITGTVSLALERMPNGRHRAEIRKLMVRSGARGRGLARALLATAERAAADAGVTLLLLDTETGTPADRLYGSAGWTCYGTVPGYATDPSGALQECSFYYKQLS